MSRDHGFHPLRVRRVVQETHDTKSFVFDVPPELHDAFSYEAGQFCTFRVPIGDDELLRCYSMSSSPDVGDPFTTTVKRVDGGLMSNWMNDTLAPGSTIEVMRPTGLFVQHDEVLGCRFDCHDARVRPAASGPGGEHPHVCSDVEDCLDRLGGQAVAHLTRRRLVLSSDEQLEKSFQVAAVLHGDSNPCARMR